VVDSSNSSSGSIFIIAENMREMQIEANVGELDIASIHRGQQVRFSLESLPGRRFSGSVENIRLIPVISSNVVSYTVMINVENRDGSLLPGMTCMVDFIVERVENILVVPNAALRYQPTNMNEQQISDMVFNASLENMNDEQRLQAIEAREARVRLNDQRQNSNTGITGIMMGQGSGTRMMTRQSGTSQGRSAPVIVMRNLWFFNGDGRLEVIQVRTGISDGSFTHVYLDDDFEGRQVILRERI
jgi:HlyD family secretion protein